MDSQQVIELILGNGGVVVVLLLAFVTGLRGDWRFKREVVDTKSQCDVRVEDAQNRAKELIQERDMYRDIALRATKVGEATAKVAEVAMKEPMRNGDILSDQELIEMARQRGLVK